MLNMVFLAALIGIVVLGVLVFVHELGHFLAAKSFGIRVLSFSIGFGKPLWKKSIGGTEYRISAIPLGGYVHMAGEHPEDVKENKPDEFNAKPIWQRAVVAVAGPFANLVFSFLLLWIIFFAGVKQELYLDRPVVGAVSDSSVAWNAGFLPGDSIIAINGTLIHSWEEIEGRFTRQESSYEIRFDRNGLEQTLTMVIPVHRDYGLPSQPFGGLLPTQPALIGAVTPGSPADSAGLHSGDLIASIDGQTVHSWYHLISILADYDTSRHALQVLVLRKNGSYEAAITPLFNDAEKRFLLGIGVGQAPTRIARYGVMKAVSKASDKTWEYTTMIFDVIGKIFSKKVSPKQLAGPLGIVQMSGLAALGGLSSILNFMALIGINLAVLNLFPLIITDGGMLLFLILEAIRGKPLSRSHQEKINRIAIIFFIALFFFVTFNDVKRVPMFFNFLGK